jgi:hypothetical protein
MGDRGSVASQVMLKNLEKNIVDMVSPLWDNLDGVWINRMSFKWQPFHHFARSHILISGSSINLSTHARFTSWIVMRRTMLRCCQSHQRQDLRVAQVIEHSRNHHRRSQSFRTSFCRNNELLALDMTVMRPHPALRRESQSVIKGRGNDWKSKHQVSF